MQTKPSAFCLRSDLLIAETYNGIQLLSPRRLKKRVHCFVESFDVQAASDEHRHAPSEDQLIYQVVYSTSGCTSLAIRSLA